MSSGRLHRQLRSTLAERIARDELRSGDRLPSERTLQVEFGCARSVVRQALQALARDGWIMPAYPRGHVVLGPRIPWLSRLRLLQPEPWQVRIVEVRETTASGAIAERLDIEPGAPTIQRASELSGAESGEPWGLGRVTYPATDLDNKARTVLLDPGEITYDHLEAAYGRRIVGYRECIRARAATPDEQRELSSDVIVEIERIARTTTRPISAFTFRGRADRFEADYLIEA